jgi:hypothetical protein
MAQELAKSLKLDYFPFSVGGGMRYAQVFGGDKLKIDDKGKQYSEFEPSDLLKAIQTPSLILIDEIFSADPEVLLGLNGLLEGGTRAIQTKAGLIKCHKDCRFIACSNTNGRVSDRNHTGVVRTDASLLDRFSKVNMGYDERVEKSLLKPFKETGLCLLGWTNELREACKRANIAFQPSTRRLVLCTELLTANIPTWDAFEMTFLEDLSDTERQKIGFKDQREG